MLFALLLALAAPPDWVPARWNWTDPASLDLLDGTPVNCLLVEWKPEQAEAISTFARKAAGKQIATLAVVGPEGDFTGAARQAMRAEVTGIVLEGDFPDGAAGLVRVALADSKAVIVEITARSKLKLGGTAPVLATYQGVWAGVQVMPDGHAKA